MTTTEMLQKAIDYMVAQMAEAIDWMVKLTGKEYREEWLGEAVSNWWECGALWSRIGYANQAVPAPLDDRLCQGPGCGLVCC